MLGSLIDTIKKMCKGCIDDDDVCIFIVAAILGFLLCYIIQRNQDPFENYAELEEAYNEKPIGSKTDSSSEVVGQKPIKRTVESVPPSLQKDYQGVMSAKQYQGVNLQNKQGLMVMDNAKFLPFQGWDFNGYAPVDLVLNTEMKVPKDLDKGPMGPDRPLANELGDAPSPSSVPSGGGSKNELKIVLIYADWCGHSKKMLPDYSKIEAEFHNQTINDTLVLIEKYTDKDKAKVKEYGVRGFPSLFSHKNGQRSPLNERTYQGLKDHIMSNV